MKRSSLTKAVRVITLLLLIPLLFIFWLIATQSGLHFIYQAAIAYVPGTLVIGKLEGSLVGSITASNLQFKQNGTLLTTDQLTLQWRPAALLSNTINITHLHLQSLTIKIAPVKHTKNKPPFILPEINLPWRIVVKNMQIDNLSVSLSEKGEQNVNIKQIKLRASSLFNQINIKSLSVKTELSELNLTGQLSTDKHYQHKLAIDWHTELPNKTVLAGKGRVEGDLNALTILQHVSGPLQFTFQAKVHELLNQLTWQAEANIFDINPVNIWPDWPGQFKGKLTSKGHTEKGQLSADVDVSQLTGTLRGFPVTLKSHLQIQNNFLTLDHFDLTSGKTTLSARGKIDSSVNVNWTLSSNNLAELYPDAQGQLQAKGHIGGTPATPELDASIKGKDLRLPGYKIGTLNGKVAFDLFHYKHVNIRLDAQALNLNKRDLKSVAIAADNHNVQIKVRTDKATALLHVKGEINNQGVKGQIVKADFSSTQLTEWKLNSPATFQYAKDLFLLEPLCWQITDGKLCATLQNNKGIWQSRFDVSKVPLMALGYWLPPDLIIEGVTDATADFKFQTTDVIEGQLHIKILPGLVSYPLVSGERAIVKYQGGILDATLNTEGLIATSEMAISHNDRFKGQLSLPGFQPLTLDSVKQPMQAAAQLNVHNLEIIEALVPEIQNPKGEIAINLTVSGTLAQPRISGNAELNNAALRIPRLGIHIEQLSLKSQSKGQQKFDFQLAARSGEGHITIQGQTVMDTKAGWPTTITIKGERFEVAHIPVSQLFVSPDLLVTLQKHTIHITGNIDIPYTKLQPKDVTTAVRISDDVVIVGDNQLIEEKWLIYTKVRLTLGERIHFYGFGFEGRFGGRLLLEDQPGQLTKATGEINIPEGRYTAYGQKLEVEHGRLLYTGSPITNPGLDIRAVRKIGNVTAGLKVKGSLKQPQVELFTIPAMGQTDALAYLLLGRPIESSTGKDGEMMAKAALALSLVGGNSLARELGERFGLDDMRVESSSTGEQASLVLGRYLSPKLYVGYGVGLIESFNTFNVRYQISEKWQLKGESGENQGADLLYTIER